MTWQRPAAKRTPFFRRIPLVSAVLMGLIAASPNAALAENATNATLAALIDRAWEVRLANDSMLAATLGDQRYAAGFEKADLAGLAKRNADFEAVLKDLNKIDPNSLSAEDQISYGVLKDELTSLIALGKTKGALMPSLPYFGFSAQLPRKIAGLPFKAAPDYENYLKRLAAVPKYFDENISVLSEGIRKGWVLPCTVISITDQSVQGQITDVEKSTFFAPFKRLPATIPEADRAILIQRGKAAVETNVLTSYKRLQQFLDSKYRPACRKDIGVSGLAGGLEFYAAALRRATTTSLSAKEIHEQGLATVARVRRDIETVMADVKFTGSFADFKKHLAESPEFYTNDPAIYLAAAAEVAKRVDGKLPEFFGRLPVVPFGITIFNMPGFTGAYYEPGAADGTRAATVYVNAADLGKRPLFGLGAVIMHEGQPGHHQQIMLWNAATDISPVRKFGLDDLSNFAVREGWGLYAESLGFEMGVYQTPYEKLGRYNLEMLRASRMVIDTGIHMLGWSEERARQYLTENSFFSDSEVDAEIKRYIVAPALNTSYMVGEMRIKAMRAHAEKQLGTRFSIRNFHDELLRHGALPLDVLDVVMDAWVKGVAMRADGQGSGLQKPK